MTSPISTKTIELPLSEAYQKEKGYPLWMSFLKGLRSSAKHSPERIWNETLNEVKDDLFDLREPLRDTVQDALTQMLEGHPDSIASQAPSLVISSGADPIYTLKLLNPSEKPEPQEKPVEPLHTKEKAISDILSNEHDMKMYTEDVAYAIEKQEEDRRTRELVVNRYQSKGRKALK